MTDRYVTVINGSNPQGTRTAAQQANPYWLQGPQDWARTHERQHHDEALYRYGEYAFFVLMWRRTDYDVGLVDRCSECFGDGSDPVQTAIAETFQQPTKERCPTCYGTTFEGGVKAKIVRPAIWVEQEESHDRDKRGETITSTLSVQSTSDFRLRSEDFVFRGDATRWSVGQIMADHLATGFRTDNEHIAFNMGKVTRQDEGTVAYDIPPDAAALQTVLSVEGPDLPFDFSAYEEINGPLIPPSYNPEA